MFLFRSLVAYAKKFSSFPSKPIWLDVEEAKRYKQQHQIKALFKAYERWLEGKNPNGGKLSAEKKKRIGGEFRWELEENGHWIETKYMSPRCKCFLIKSGYPWPTLEEQLDPFPRR